VISDVQDEFSTGKVLYASLRAMVGDQLQEVARRGVELTGYVDSMTNGLSGVTYTVGLKAIASRGFYQWRPFFGLEIPFRGLVVAQTVTLFPANLFLGGEYNIIVGRLRIVPNVALGLGGAVPLGAGDQLDSFYLSHIGVQAKVTTSILVSRDVQVFVDAGIAYWGSMYDDPSIGIPMLTENYGGLLIGAGATLK